MTSPQDNYKLFFVEQPEHVPLAILQAEESSLPTVFIALSPNAGYEFEKRSIAFKDICDFYDLSELSGLDASNVSKLVEFCQFSDAFLRKNIDAIRNSSLECTFSAYYNFRMLASNLSLYCLVLKKVFSAYPRASEVWFCGSGREPLNYDLCFQNESLWPRLLKKYCAENNICCQKFEWQGEKPQRTLASSRNRKDFLLYAVKFFVLLKELFFIQWSGRRKRLFVLDKGYNILPVFDDNKKKRTFYVCHITPLFSLHKAISRHLVVKTKNHRAIDSQMEQNWKQIIHDPSFRSYFVFSGIDTFNLIEDRLRYFYITLIGDMISLYSFCQALLNWFRPTAVIASAMGRCHEKVISSCARSLNIPFLVYQHGEMGYKILGPKGHYHWYYNDIYFSDYLLVYGEGQRCFFREKFACADDIVPVGSTVLDRLSQRNGTTEKKRVCKKLDLYEGKRIVVYPAGQLAHGIKIPPTYRTDSAYFAMQKRIVDLFAEFPGIQFVIKIRSQWGLKNPIVNYIEDQRIANIKVEQKMSFQDMISVADLFVIDWPSTALLEALTTDKPIFLTDYLLDLEWHPWFVEELEKRVFYERNLDHFLARLLEYLKRGQFTSHPSRILLQRFGTYKDDGNSGERALDFIAKVAENNHSKGKAAAYKRKKIYV